MRKFVLPAAVAAAMTFVMADAAPAQAQVFYGRGYAPQTYYSGYTPYPSYGSGLTLGNGGLLQSSGVPVLSNSGFGLSSFPSYSFTPSTFNSYSTYGSRSYYGSGYNSYGSYGNRGYYGGYRSFRGRR